MHKRLTAGDLYGERMSTRQIAGLTYTDIAYSAGCKVPTHSHELAQFCLVNEGSFSEVYGRRSREGKPLTLIARPASETHSHHFYHQGARCFVIEFGNEALRRIHEYLTVLDDSNQFPTGTVTWLARRIYNEFYVKDQASSLAIEGLTLELVAETSRENSRRLQRTEAACLKRAKDFLHAHLREPITLGIVAAASDLHPVYLARVFRRTHHCTLGQYLRRLRIEYACREITLTNASLTEISVSAGFYDQSHFSRTFKQIVGVTPREYRQAFHHG